MRGVTEVIPQTAKKAENKVRGYHIGVDLKSEMATYRSMGVD